MPQRICLGDRRLQHSTSQRQRLQQLCLIRGTGSKGAFLDGKHLHHALPEGHARVDRSNGGFRSVTMHGPADQFIP